MKRLKLSLLIIIFNYSCAVSISQKITDNSGRLPERISGEFADDYGIRYSITDSLWIQHPGITYRILETDTINNYLLAENSISDSVSKPTYTRIDYMYFDNMPIYSWGFCLTVYNAKSLDEARVKAKADRSNPRKGCGGYPFSRMKSLPSREEPSH